MRHSKLDHCVALTFLTLPADMRPLLFIAAYFHWMISDGVLTQRPTVLPIWFIGIKCYSPARQ